MEGTMIKITNTPNLLGISIHGDYEDLKALHIAMSDYLDFYFNHMKEPGAYNCYETILGLCYDIRHAYQGDRNIESIENNAENISQLASLIYEVDEAAIMKERKKYKNGNLYFNVEVLYPWAVFYLYALEAIAKSDYPEEWLEDITHSYNKYQAEHDLSLIKYFVQLLWKNIKELLPDDVFEAIWDYSDTVTKVKHYFGSMNTYIGWLCRF